MSETIDHKVPVHPKPGIFESIVVTGYEGATITHKEIEEIQSREPWSFEAADLRIMATYQTADRRRRAKSKQWGAHEMRTKPPRKKGSQ